ncbi:MAG: TolC family protein [bacterium]
MWKRLAGMLFLLPAILTGGEVFAGSRAKATASPPLTLEEAVVQTLQQNPELKSMQKDVDAAHEKISQARSWDDPQIGVRFYQVPFNGGIDDAQDIDYIVSQKIPFPGKKKAASQIVYHDYLHHIELLGARGREMLRDVKTAYYDLFSVERQLEQSRQIEGVLKGLIQTAQVKLATGEVLAGDSVQGQTELAKLLIEREPLIERKKSLAAKLNQLMARPEDGEIKLPSKLEIPSWDLKLEDLIEIAQLRHPSVKMAEHNIEQKKWGVKAAKRDYLPDLSAQLEYVQRPGPAENAWTGEFMVNIPLLVKKKMKAVSQAEAELAGAQYSNIAAKNEVSFKVKEAYAKMKAAQKILKLNQSTLVPQTRQGFQMMAAAYTAGKASFLNYLAAARSLFDAQMQYWKSFDELAERSYELEVAVGATHEELANLQAPSPVDSLTHPSSELNDAKK